MNGDFIPQRWYIERGEVKGFFTLLPRVFSRYRLCVKKRLSVLIAFTNFAFLLYAFTPKLNTMPNEQTFIFKREEMLKLMELKADKIVIRTRVEEAKLDNGERVGVVRVYADAMVEGDEEPVGTIPGCPKPPCS